MLKILINAANEYVQNLTKIVNEKFMSNIERGSEINFPIKIRGIVPLFFEEEIKEQDSNAFKSNPRIFYCTVGTIETLRQAFPDSSDSHYQLINKLITRLLDMVPAMSRFLVDKNNLISDRMLAASVILYLITPFTIILDDEGLAGAVDDVLVTFRLANNMLVPSDEIVSLLKENQWLILEVESGLPEWVIFAVSQIVQSILDQQKSFKNSRKKGKI